MSIQIDHQLRQLCEDLLFDRRRYDADGNCIYDPLEELLKKTGSFHLANFNEDRENLNWHQRITRNIMEGKKSSLNEDLQDALEKMDAIKIINKLMVPAMADVGKLFEKGETQLPFVLKSAEVISRALEILKPHLQGKKVMDRGVVLLATVQGDIHDIGKNLAKIILTSNGFQVKDLGVNVTCEKIIKAIKEINPVALGLSALLVKSTQAMRHTLQMLDSHNLTLPVIVGGAPLSADFVTQDLSPAYRGPVYYAKDAVSALKILKKDDLETEDGQDIESKAAGSKVTKPQDTDLEIANSALLNKTMQQKLQKAVSLDAPDLVKIVPLIKNNMLKKLWGMATKGGPANTSAQEILQDFQHYRQTMEKMAQKAGRIKPKTISIFLPMTCLDHKLIIKANNSYHLQKLIKLIGKSPEDLLYFNFRPGPKNSILKHFSASPLVDIGALMVVSIGLQATLFQQELEQRGNFLEMFLWHGFCASLTEALAQYQHDQLALCYNRVIAAEIDENQNFITLKQQTRRFSPGYPSWPDLFEQRKIFAILNPAKIGVQLSDTCQLQPEYSISALISFHKHETENRREKI